jgi:hypothetical protein
MTGVTRFELPLRGEAFSARSNEPAIGEPFETKSIENQVYPNTDTTRSHSEGST